LNPLALKVYWNFRAKESTGAGVLDLDPGSSYAGLWVEENDPLLVASPRCAPLDPGRHDGFPIRIQSRQGFQSSDGFWSENVRVSALEVSADFQLSCGHESPLQKSVNHAGDSVASEKI
jgi:hypothetical protein